MIAHIVLFQPRPDLTDDERTDMLAALIDAAKGIPQVRHFRVGRRITHGLPGYEQVMRDDYAFAAIIEFDTVDGLKSYLAHPSHERLARHFASSASRALAYDYEVSDAADAAHLFRP